LKLSHFFAMATGGMLKESLDSLEVATEDVVASMEVS
jgi:hypothetical protein